MSEEISLITVEPRTIAAIRDTIPRKELGNRIRPLFDRVYAALKEEQIPHTGRNIIVYRGGTPEHLEVEAGVSVSERFSDAGELVCTETPSGSAVLGVHHGPYHLMHRTYDAIHRWSEERRYSLSGPSWEIYGHWNDDPALLETEIHHLLGGEKSQSEMP